MDGAGGLLGDGLGFRFAGRRFVGGVGRGLNDLFGDGFVGHLNLQFQVPDQPRSILGEAKPYNHRPIDVKRIVDDLNNMAYKFGMSLETEITEIESRVAALDLSMAWVLRRCGVERATWTHWKSGIRSPMKETWDKIAAEVSEIEIGLTKSAPGDDTGKSDE